MSSNRIRDEPCEERDRLLLQGDWQALDDHVLACPRCREQRGLNGNGDAPAAAGDGDEAPTSPTPARDSVAAPVVPGYRILARLAEGGMGVVYKAEHVASGRVVALKMLKADDGAGPEELHRFRAEAEVVASLRHPNIVEMIEVGECDGRPFFSMELCEGGSLAAQLDGPLPSRQAAALVEVLARAVQAAHDRGVIHRDLKPANVLLTADETPKISDFGLAKKLDETGWTSTGRVMGTPHYMAPEQAGGRKREIGPTTDLYALGVILYELMTGKPPFHEIQEPAAVVYHILNVTPPPPSSVRPDVDRGLEEICLKCLRKDSRKRYRSARALANALRRFQRGGSVRLTVAAAAALATTVAVAALVVFGGDWQTERAREDLARRVNEAENKVIPGLRVDLADANGRVNDLTAKQAVLERDRAAAVDGRRKAEARIQAAEDAAAGANKRADGLAAQLGEAAAQIQDLNNKLADSETARTAAEGRAEAAEKKAAEAQQKPADSVFAAALLGVQNILVRQLVKEGAQVLAAGWSSDGRFMRAVSRDGTLTQWDASEDGQPPTTKKIGFEPITAVFSADGKWAIFAGDDEIRVFDLEASKEVKKITTRIDHHAFWGRPPLAVSASGKYIAVFYRGDVAIWDAASGRQLKDLDTTTVQGIGPGDSPTCAGFSPAQDEKLLVIGSNEGRVILWNWDSDKPAASKQVGEEFVGSVAFSPDGKRLAVGSGDHRVYIVNPEDNSIVHVLGGHRYHVVAVCWPTDSRLLASGDYYGTIMLWDAKEGKAAPEPSCFDTGAEDIRLLSRSPKDPQMFLAVGKDDLSLYRAPLPPKQDK